tara:strand:+ start:316 stop:795 length:480 start_codon:yes stop_codon:yes gene_type:complete
MLRKCNSCGIEAQDESYLSLFVTNSRALYSKENKCKTCKSNKFKQWRLDNPSHRRQNYLDNRGLQNRQSLQWARSNPAAANALTMKRIAAKLKATPSWADMDEIKDIYIEAKYFDMEVDHIFPLQSKLVCGLHVACNLQLLSRSDNASKGNKLNWKRTA